MLRFLDMNRSGLVAVHFPSCEMNEIGIATEKFILFPPKFIASIVV
jgi:hypothetical protein